MKRKSEVKGDADAYARSLEHPEEFWQEFRARERSKGQARAALPKGRFKAADYVGYGHPPRHTQFKKGQSGNPAGRPRGAKSLKRTVEELLTKKIQISESGKTRRVPVFEAMLLRQISMALNGNLRAIETLSKFATQVGLVERQEEELIVGDLEPLTIEELNELERLLEKCKGGWVPRKRYPN
jgi:hypothetical protein